MIEGKYKDINKIMSSYCRILPTLMFMMGSFTIPFYSLLFLVN